MLEFNITKLETIIKLKLEKSEKLEKNYKQIINENKNLLNEIKKNQKNYFE